MRTAFALYNKISAILGEPRWPCTSGGLWDFFARSPQAIYDDLMVWACDGRLEDEAGLCLTVASLTESTDQWNANGGNSTSAISSKF